MKKVFYFLILLMSFLMFSCKNSAGGDVPSNSETVINVARPVILPGSGEYVEGTKNITITTETKGADIFYTTDGTNPTSLSCRYVGAFPIFCDKTVKAIAIVGKYKSPIATNSFKLNAGKSKNQLGSIYGKVDLSESLSSEVREKVKNDTIYVYTEAFPDKVITTKVGENYHFDGLDTSKAYSFYFSNKEPGSMNSRKISWGTSEENGRPIIAIVINNQQPSEGIGLNVDVALKSTGTISGKVLKYDVEGKAESDNGGINVFIPGTSYSAFTNASGDFTMTGVPQGAYTLRAQYANYTPKEIEGIKLFNVDSANKSAPSYSIKDPIELYFAKGNLKGIAVLDDSSINENSNINVVISNKENTKSYNAITKANGSWGVTDIYPGIYSVEFSKDGYNIVVLDDVFITGAKTEVIPSVTLQVIGGSLKGNVNIENKTDNTGIAVLLKKIVTTENPKEKSYYGLTDNFGNFSFDNIMPGDYTLSASYPGYATVEKKDIKVSQGDKISGITLPSLIESNYSVTGKVLLEGLSKGFEGTNIVLADVSTLKPVLSTTTGLDGTYSFTDVKVGNYVIIASRDGYLTNNETAVNVNSSTVTAANDIILKNAKGSVIGSVSLESSIDYSGINILLKSESNKKTYSTITDTEGKYSFSGVEPGNWIVQATKSGYNTKFTQAFSVSAGVIAEANSIELPVSLRSVFGSVTLEGRSDFTGVRITATKTTNVREIYSALSNNNGFYALTGMTPGEYILNFSYEGYVSQSSSSVNVNKESSVELKTLELKKATGAITGVVTLQGSSDRSGVKVSLVGTEYTYTTGSDGVYQFNVPAGNYPGGVRFEREDFGTTAKADTIPVLNDSTYAVLDVEMKCNAITVKGVIDFFGKDDNSGIKVLVDGLDPKVYSATTDVSGKWELKHVPLGYKTIRFQKEFAADITTEILIEPGLELNLGLIEMMPNAATIKGYVYLEGMSDNRNITVTVTTPGKEDIVVKTTSDGMFEATNIIATGKHTLIFSKDGWESKSIEINDLKPMDVTFIGKNKEYVLSDKKAPVWSYDNPIVLNDGANFVNNYDVKIAISAEDKGSGIDQMAIQVAREVDSKETDKFPLNIRWEEYKVGSNFNFKSLPENYLGAGTYVFYITLKDKAGNISSTLKKSITLTNVVTTLSGRLSGDKLHLTKISSPYIVEADCLVPENEEFIIDPGVEVRFAGNYSIAVSGTIKACGTNEEKIILTKNDDAVPKDNYGDNISYWNGISVNGGFLSMSNGYNYSDGNIIENCIFEYAETPLTVKNSTYVKNNVFKNNASSVSVGGDKSVIIGNKFENGLIIDNMFDGESIIIINNEIQDRVNIGKRNTIVSNNNFFESYVYIESVCKIFNNNFEKSSIDVSAYLDEYSNNLAISNNNFIDCNAPFINASTEYKFGFYYNLKGNFFGTGNTEELESKGTEADISFINDYYDDFNLMRFDYSDWKKTPFVICGYNKNGAILFDYSINGYSENLSEIKDSNILININPLLKNNKFSYVRIAQSFDDLENATWLSYSDVFNFNIDTSKVKDGVCTILIQVKDANDNISSVVRKEIPYDTNPIASINMKDNIHYSGNTEKVELSINCHDNGEIVKNSFFIDDILYESRDRYNLREKNIVLPIKNLSAGKHILKFIAYDSLGNKGVSENIFYVDRNNIDNSKYPGKTFDNLTGQFIKDINTSYLWHLDNNGCEFDADNALTLDSTLSRGGFNGCAKVLSTYVPLNIDLDNLTIEFWIKGDGFDIEKEDVFRFDNNSFNVSVKDLNDGTLSQEYLSINSLNDSKWHYYACTFGPNNIIIYRDGLVMKSLELKKQKNNNTNKVYFSSYSGTVIDEIRISNCIRSCDEISTYYKASKNILDNNTGSMDAIIW